MTVFYGDNPGFGNNAFGRHQYGGMASVVEPRFHASVPSDGATDISPISSVKTEVYGFSSRIYDVSIEISEDGAGFSNAYINGAFVDPYDAVESWADLHQVDPQLAIVKVVKTIPFDEEVTIVVRVTALDQFGQEATKTAAVEW